tara:strand:- start:4350 stop:5078 length:729 start_codon:yes stop_codon:yes gene_type:complete
MSYAKGKYAYGICDRSGLRYKYNDLKKTWDGLKVGPDQYEPKHPQLQPNRVFVDPEALYQSRPDIDKEVNVGIVRTTSSNPQYNTTDDFIGGSFNLLSALGGVGEITVSGVSSSTPSPSPTPSPTPAPTPSPSITTYTVTVAAYYGANYFYVDGSRAPTLNFTEGQTYKFDQSDSTNNNHPLRFSITSNGTHAGGVEYTTGVTTNGVPGESGAYTQIEVASGAPTLYYYCTNHSGMGGQINT